MSTDRYDAVVAGAGASGLSLAAHLAASGWRDRRVLLVDDPGARPAAQCWGSWVARPGLLDDAVSRRYRSMRVHADGHDAVVPLDGFEYQVVRRPDLWRAATAIVGRCPDFTVVPGRVQRIRDGRRGADVIVDDTVYAARWVFDSVSVDTHGPADARLAFTGWEIECAGPVFDPAVPTLFDFRVPQDGAARFVYVLPDTASRALVEFTEFVPRDRRPAGHEVRAAALDAYVAQVLHAGPYEIRRSETAVLPLRVAPPPRGGGHVLAIGAHGGLIKASTGYAYQRIQRDSAAIARSLVRHGHPFDRQRSARRYRFLDSVLLDVLARDPGEIERAFARLFRANPAGRVLRFLDERSTVGEEVHLVASLPPAPYVGAVAARLLRAGRVRGT